MVTVAAVLAPSRRPFSVSRLGLVPSLGCGRSPGVAREQTAFVQDTLRAFLVPFPALWARDDYGRVLWHTRCRYSQTMWSAINAMLPVATAANTKDTEAHNIVFHQDICSQCADGSAIVDHGLSGAVGANRYIVAECVSRPGMASPQSLCRKRCWVI
jgi:hypothetical protein